MGFMDKRGESDLLWNVIQAVLIVTVMASIFYWINDVSSGKLIGAQIDAKESAILSDVARPGTNLILNKTLSVNGNNITADFGGGAFSYSTFNPKVSLKSAGNVTEIKV